MVLFRNHRLCSGWTLPEHTHSCAWLNRGTGGYFTAPLLVACLFCTCTLAAGRTAPGRNFTRGPSALKQKRSSLTQPDHEQPIPLIYRPVARNPPGLVSWRYVIRLLVFWFQLPEPVFKIQSPKQIG